MASWSNYSHNSSTLPTICLAAADRASEGDRRWFLQNPDRAYRLRLALKNEYPGATWVQLTLAKQVRPSTRVRLPLWTTRPMCDCERCLAEVWNQVAPAQYREMAVDLAALSLRAGL